MAGDDLLENREEVEDRRVDLGVRVVGLDLAALKDGLLDRRLLVKHLGGGLEFFVFEQAVDKLLTRVLDLLILRCQSDRAAAASST